MILNIIKAKMRAKGPHFLIHRIPICFKISQVALDDLTPKIYLCSAPLIAFKNIKSQPAGAFYKPLQYKSGYHRQNRGFVLFWSANVLSEQ